MAENTTNTTNKEAKNALVESAVKYMNKATTKSTIKDKLSSRKFWISAAGMIVGIVGMIGLNDNIAAIIAFGIIELGSIIAYCVSEGMVDAASVQSILKVISEILAMVQKEESGENIEMPDLNPNADNSTAVDSKAAAEAASEPVANDK